MIKRYETKIIKSLSKIDSYHLKLKIMEFL